MFLFEYIFLICEWVDIVCCVLIEEGIVEVKIDKFVWFVGVICGGFYWCFKSRDELLDVLIEDWWVINIVLMLWILVQLGMLCEWMECLVDFYIVEDEFSLNYDQVIWIWVSLVFEIVEIVWEVDGICIEVIW